MSHPLTRTTTRALTVAVSLVLLLTACGPKPEPAEEVARKTSPASMSLVATTASLVGRYRLSPLASTRVYAYTLLAAYRAHATATEGMAEADAATAGELVGATLFLDPAATRELDAMRRRYAPVQTAHGQDVAKEILALAATDRYDELLKVQGVPPTPAAETTPQNWQWEPTGLFKTNAIEPLWGQLTPITSAGSKCDIPAPDFTSLETEGRAMLTAPDIDNSVSPSVLLWLAGPGTPGPAGQWLVAANEYLAGQSPDVVTETLAQAAVAAFDVSILLWREKFQHMVARPETMYQRWFGNELLLARETPGHPSYPSGHSGFSRAVADVLTTTGVRPIVFKLPDDMIARPEAKTFDNPVAAADDASRSRVAAFFHYPSDTRAGAALGACAARAALTEVGSFADGVPQRDKAKPFPKVREQAANSQRESGQSQNGSNWAGQGESN